MKDDTVYVVSGYMRTGTSMVMKALEEGGMVAVYRQSREEMRLRHADEHYDPNIGGLYELERTDYSEWDFPEKYKGKLIKALNSAVPRMAVMPSIKVVFLRRDAEEVRQSFNAFFGGQLQKTDDLDKGMEDVIKRIQNRKDVKSLDVFWYREFLNNPLKHLLTLKEHGWPINIEKAASVINPQLIRFKKEDLTIGI